MPDSNLDVAVRIKTHLQGALQDFDRLEKGLGGTGKAADRARGRMRRLATAMDGAVRGTSALGRHVRYLATGLAGFSLARVIGDVVRNTIRQEQAIAQVEARIRATGGAAGLASEEIQRMAASLQDVTTYGDEAVLEMQALLLSFRKLDGAQFERISAAALDMATALSQGPREAALQLAKALEDPVQGLTALRRSGTVFSQAQTDVIRSLTESGRVAEAQTRILDELERQYGGAARAARDTLGGALTSLRNAWGDLLEQHGRTDDLRISIESLISTLKDPDATRNVRAIGAEIFTMIQWVVDNADTVLTVMGAITGAASLAAFGPGAAAAGAVAGGYAGSRIIDDSAKESNADIERQIELLRAARAAAEENTRLSVQEQRNLTAYQDAEIRRLERMLNLRRSIRQERLRETTLATLDRDLDEKYVAPSTSRVASSAGDEDKLLALRAAAEDRIAQLTLDRIALVNRAERQQIDEARAIAGASEQQLAETITAIQEAATEKRLRIRSEEAEEARRIREQSSADLAALTQDEIDAEAAGLARLTALRASLAGPYEAALHAAEAWRAEQERTLAALAAQGHATEALGAIVETVYRDMIAGAARGAADAEAALADQRLRDATDFESGVTRALKALDAELGDFASLSENAVTGAFRGMEDALVRFISTGKAGFADLARIAIRQQITGPLFNWFSGAFAGGGGQALPVPAGVNPGIGHTGGIAGALGVRRTGVPPAAWLGAPRFHRGGIPGLTADEIPVIVRRDEGIFTPEQMRALGRTGAGPQQIDVRIDNRGTPQAVQQAAPRLDADRLVIDIVTDDIARGGRIARVLATQGA